MATFDHRTCPRCGGVDGLVFEVTESMPGENYPPMHPRCRCTVVPSLGEVVGKRTSKVGGKRVKVPANMTYSEWKKTYIDNQESNTNSNQTGALNDKNDPDGKRRDKHAELYYNARRNSKKMPFVQRIAENSGMRLKSVDKIFDHIFINEHNLDGEIKKFDPSYYMAESFRRISEGKNIQPHDIIMLKHEWLELSLMKRYNYDYETAHVIAERKYNYSLALKKWRKENE